MGFFSESEQLVFTTVHTAGIEGNIPELKEILDIAKPLIVICRNWKDCRIHQESAPVAKLLIREYLQNKNVYELVSKKEYIYLMNRYSNIDGSNPKPFGTPCP